MLLALGDSVTTDHISPAGAIAKDSPAGRYLVENGVPPEEFNSYGARRGNDRVMTRGTFANIRIRNLLAPGTEGGVTRLLPEGEQMAVYDTAVKYRERGVPLVVLAGAEYGTGSSRDWAAKGTMLLGVRAVWRQALNGFTDRTLSEWVCYLLFYQRAGKSLVSQVKRRLISHSINSRREVLLRLLQLEKTERI